MASDERRDRVVSVVRPLCAVGELPPEGEASLRYHGQSFELAVPLGERLAERFHEAHAARYGYADARREVELVALRTWDVSPGPALHLAGPDTARPVHGPLLLELPGATCWIPAGWAGLADTHGTLRLERAR